jgi:hypothetical protein
MMRQAASKVCFPDFHGRWSLRGRFHAASTRTPATSHARSPGPRLEQSRRDRKRVEKLFAHLKRILKLGRLRLRGPRGARLAAIAQNLRRLAKLVAQPPPAAAACIG